MKKSLKPKFTLLQRWIFPSVVTIFLAILTVSGGAQVLLFDNLEQFANGTTISIGHTYSPASGWHRNVTKL